MRLPARRFMVARCGRAARRGPGRAAAAALAVTLLAAGRHVPGTSSGASGAAGLPQLTVAASPGVANVPLYLAVREGLFQQAGLRVSVRTYASAAKELKALQGGR